jgi:hypothetical protein
VAAQELMEAAAEGCQLLRVDVGVADIRSKRVAFLNELTVPQDAMMYHSAHQSDLMYALGSMLAEGLFGVAVPRSWRLADAR